MAACLCDERPAEADTDLIFVVPEGPRRGRPLSAGGLDEIVAGARRRAGIEALTCHQLRHTCFTRLREAGMALEAIQAQAGHRSIEPARIYLHLANDWLAGEYRRADRGDRCPTGRGVVMPAALCVDDRSGDELDEFGRALEAAGQQPWASTLRAARTFRSRVDRAGGWDRVELDTQLEWMRRARPFVSWLLVTGRLAASADLLAQADLRLGLTARKHLVEVHAWFVNAADRVDATDEDTALQWERPVQSGRVVRHPS